MSELRTPFWFGPPDRADPDGASRYLSYLSDCLCYGLWARGAKEASNWQAKFRRFTDEMGISAVECRGLSFDAEVKAVLSPDNPAALAWARACIETGLTGEVDPLNPGTVIARLYWPTGSFIPSGVTLPPMDDVANNP